MLYTNFEIIFTLEEHQISNGLGSIISNFIIDNNLKAKIHKFAINNKYLEFSSSLPKDISVLIEDLKV